MIYFTDILFDNSPLLWELNTEKTSAVCLGKCVEEKGLLSITDIRQSLSEQNIEGITIKGHKITIFDLETFKKTHTEKTLPEETPPEKKAVLKRKMSSPLLFHRHTPENSDKRLSRTLSNNGIRSILKLSKKLQFEALLKPIEGETLCYFSLAKKNTAIITRVEHLKVINDRLLLTIEQVVKDRVYYALRLKQLACLERLFNDLLHPACQQLHEKINAPESIVNYFQNAVLFQMLNIPLNMQPGPYDSMSPEDIKGNMPDKHVFLLEEAYEERMRRAESMLIYLEFFIRDDRSVNKLTADKQLAQWLILLKQDLKEQREALSDILAQLKKLIVPLGVISFENTKIHLASFQTESMVHLDRFTAHLTKLSSTDTLLHYALHEINMEGKELALMFEHPVFTKFTSLKSILNESLEQIYSKVKPADRGKLVPMILNSTITKLMEQYKNGTSCLPKLYEDDNLYLHSEWAKTLKTALMEVIQHKPKKTTSINKNTNVEIIKTITDFFNHQIEKEEEKKPGVTICKAPR